MYRLQNPVRRHDWGSPDDIPRLLGQGPDGSPQAELWLGAYEDESSTLQAGGARRRLCDVVADEGAPRLPFLAKVLAIGAPLSLQLHPDGPEAKPEMLYALRECRVLCGFRAPAQLRESFAQLPSLRPLAPLLDRPDGLRAVTARLLEGDDPRLVAAVTDELAASPSADLSDLVADLSLRYPGDPAALAPLLLESVDLRPGEVLFCAPGQPHTYLHGLGFEVQASSDAVLRGGLTTKQVDVAAFLAALDTMVGASRVEGELRGAEQGFDAGVPAFALGVIRAVAGSLPDEAGPQILLCASGRFDLSARSGSVRLGQGESVYVPPGSIPLTASGDGLLLRVVPGRAGWGSLRRPGRDG